MTDASLHLKLDRVLAGLAALSSKQDELEEGQAALAAGLKLLRADLGDTRAAVQALAEAADEDPGGGGELAEALRGINGQLEQIAADGTRMVTVVNGLPRVLSDAAMDAVSLAMGGGMDSGENGSS